MKTLREAFDIKVRERKQNVLSDYEIFPDKKLLDKLRTEIIENLIDNEMPNHVSLNEWINDEQFMTYYVSVSGHMPYTINGNNMSKKNWDLVKDGAVKKN